MYSFSSFTKKYGLWDDWLKKNKGRLKGHLLGGPAQVPPKRIRGATPFATLGDGASFNSMPAVNEETLLELAYNHRDDLEADSRLIWMGIKHHLRNPQNFQKLLDSHSYINAFGLIKSHEYKLPSEHIFPHEDLQKKYGENIPHVIFGPKEEGLLHATSANLGSMNPPKEETKGWLWWKEKVKTAPINLWNFKSLHPDNMQKQSFQDTHKQFMGELSKRFSTWHHEFTHFHDVMVGGKEFPKGNKTRKDYDYENEPFEVHAFNRELNHELDRAIRLKPHKFRNLPTHDKHFEVLKRLTEINYPDFDESSFQGRIKKIQYELEDLKKPNSTKHWDYHYNKLSHENKIQFNATIDTLLNKYAHKLHSPKVVVPPKSFSVNLSSEDYTKRARKESQKRYRERKKRQIALSKPTKPKAPREKPMKLTGAAAEVKYLLINRYKMKSPEAMGALNKSLGTNHPYSKKATRKDFHKWISDVANKTDKAKLINAALNLRPKELPKEKSKKSLAEAWQWHIRQYPKSNKSTKLRKAIRYLNVGPHELSIHFEPHSEEKKSLISRKSKEIDRPKEYEVAYQVDNSLKAGNVTDPKNQKAILKTVHDTIDKFTTRIKPKALHFVSVNDRTKARLHAKLAAHLAKKHGGKDELYSYPEDPEKRNILRSKVKFKK